MPRYQVLVRETNTYYVEVDADTPELAVEQVESEVDEADEFTDVTGEDPRWSDVQVLDPEEIA